MFTKIWPRRFVYILTFFFFISVIFKFAKKNITFSLKCLTKTERFIQWTIRSTHKYWIHSTFPPCLWINFWNKTNHKKSHWPKSNLVTPKRVARQSPLAVAKFSYSIAESAVVICNCYDQRCNCSTSHSNILHWLTSSLWFHLLLNWTVPCCRKK